MWREIKYLYPRLLVSILKFVPSVSRQFSRFQGDFDRFFFFANFKCFFRSVNRYFRSTREYPCGGNSGTSIHHNFYRICCLFRVCRANLYVFLRHSQCFFRCVNRPFCLGGKRFAVYSTSTAPPSESAIIPSVSRQFPRVFEPIFTCFCDLECFYSFCESVVSPQ